MSPSLPALAALLAAALPIAAQTHPEVRLVCLAPSTYTHRNDALRAGLGIHILLQELIASRKLPLRTTFFDGVRVFDKEEPTKNLVRGARVLILGGSVWAQGSSYYLRRFFELVNMEPLTGVPVSAWATAGGAHTGGDTVIGDIFRTAMGMGAPVFSLGQKYMVFTTDERLSPDEGDFTAMDAWFMDQFARTIAVVALAGNDPAKAASLSKDLGTSPHYWELMPKNQAALARYAPLVERLNAAADRKSPAFRELLKLVQ